MKKQSITDRFIPKNDKGKYVVENSITRMRLKEHIAEISEKVANVLSVVEVIEGCDIADKETHYAITKLIQEAYSVLLDVSSDLEVLGEYGFCVSSDKAKAVKQIKECVAAGKCDGKSAYQKLQSALSGQARAMREFGVDISVATMQEKAYALGINKSVTAMTQAEKAQLRYIMIMEGLTVAQGDMARTLESPANQLRILSAQFVQLTRAIGNVFIPMVTAVLPYINAVVMGVKNLITSLAKLVGYEIPDFKATPVQIFDTEDATGEVDNVTQSVKDLKKTMLGIDELNVMSDNSSASAGASAGGSTIDLSAQIAEMNAAYKDMVAGITDSIGSKSTDILESWRVSFAEFKAAWGGECQKTLGIIPKQVIWERFVAVTVKAREIKARGVTTEKPEQTAG